MNAPCLAAEGGWQQFELGGAEWAILAFAGISALLALAVGAGLTKQILAKDQGTPKMIEDRDGDPRGRAGLPQAPVQDDRDDPRTPGRRRVRHLDGHR